MDEPPATPPKRRMSWAGWIFGLVLFLLAASLLVPTYEITGDNGPRMKASNNCRWITMAMKLYASDHNGQYPTGATANETFRQLIQEELLPDERIFGSPKSPYLHDGNIGDAPDYAQALPPGENHWMLVDGMNEKSPGTQALVFENSLDTTWPPRWDTDTPEEPIRGRTWKTPPFGFGTPKIIIGHNDGTVTIEKVDPKTGHLESQSQPDAPFPLPQGNLKLLDIEE